MQVLVYLAKGITFAIQKNDTMKTTCLSTAENWRNNAFTNCGKSLMIVMMKGYYYITSRKEASKLQNQGYEVF